MDDTLDLAFSASGPEVIFENFGDEMVIANLESGFFYSLDGSGAEIWNALVAGHTGRQFAAASKADIDGGAAEVARFIAELQSEGLLAPTARPANPDPIPSLCSLRRRFRNSTICRAFCWSTPSTKPRPPVGPSSKLRTSRPADMIEAKRGGALAEAAASDFVGARPRDRPFAANRIVEVGPLTVAMHFADRDLEGLFADAFYPAPAASAASWSLFVLAAAERRAASLARFQRERAGDASRRERRPVLSLDGPAFANSLYCRSAKPPRGLLDREKSAVKAWERSRPFLPALQAMFDDSPWLAVHAAALALDDRAILLAGAGRAGKTTLSLAGLSAGWRFIGDDYVLVDSREQAPAVAPLFATARLRDDMVARFPNLAGARTAISNDFEERRHELSLRGIPELRGGAAKLEQTPLSRAERTSRARLRPGSALEGSCRDGGQHLHRHSRRQGASVAQAVAPLDGGAGRRFDPGPRIEDALAALMAGLS